MTPHITYAHDTDVFCAYKCTVPYDLCPTNRNTNNVIK